MACCDECGCFDDNWVDGEDITEEELEKDPLYEPHRYYYWQYPLEEDYQMPSGFECLCEICFDILNAEGKIAWKDDKNPFECTSLISGTQFPHSIQKWVIL